MYGHFDQVVCSVSINTARRVNQSFVLDRVWVEEQTFAGEARHFGPGDELLVLQNDLAKFLVGSIFGAIREGHHVLLELSALFKQLGDVGLALLFRLLLEFLARRLLRITLLISIKVQVVADLLGEGRDASTWAEAAQNFEDVAVRHSYFC